MTRDFRLAKGYPGGQGGCGSILRRTVPGELRVGRGEREELNGPVQEEAASVTVAARTDLRPNRLGVAGVEESPDHRGRPNEPPPRVPAQHVRGDGILGDDAA